LEATLDPRVDEPGEIQEILAAMAVDYPIPACKFDIDYIKTMDQAAL
jgi:hypothetical protein